MTLRTQDSATYTTDTTRRDPVEPESDETAAMWSLPTDLLNRVAAGSLTLDEAVAEAAARN